MRKVHLLLSVIGWLSIIIVTAWCVLHLATGDSIPIIRLMNYLAPWLGMWLLLLCLLSLFSRRFLLAVALFLPAVVVAYPHVQQFVPRNAHPQVHLEEATYKVMSYSKMGRNRKLDAVAAVIMKERPDILFMQEVGSAIMPLLASLYDGNKVHFVRNKVGIVVSRYPIAALERRDGILNVATLDVSGNTTITIWDVHLEKSFTSSRMQMQQVRSVLEDVAQASGPMIVAGDFNATPDSEPYILTNRMLKNAHAEAGFGFGFTFPSPARRMGYFTPFMRIDHIFYNDYFLLLDAYVVKDSGGSDHYPIVAIMRLI